MIKRKRSTESDDIIACSASSCAYVDEQYFKEEMHETANDSRSTTYAVKIQGVRADWIVNKKKGDGIGFLTELLNQKNREVILTPYI